MTNTVASGITYDDFSAIVERVAELKARHHLNIGYLDEEDIKQEVRIKCWEIMNRVDNDIGQPDSFFAVCAEHRLTDLKRSLIYKHQKPCFKCPHWNKDPEASGSYKCFRFEDRSECERFSKHEKFVALKIASNYPYNLHHEPIYDETSHRGMERVDLEDYIYTHLPEFFHPYFKTVQENGYNFKVLKAKMRATLLNLLREILKEYKE